MHSHRDPWKWPFALGLASLLTASLFFLIPLEWLDGLFQRGDRQESATRKPAPWLILIPPPELVVAPEPAISPPENGPPPQPAPPEDPRWWSEGWRVRIEREAAATVASTLQDSVGYLLSALGVGQDFLTLSRPDSVLASKLAFMQLEDSFAFDELKPYLGALTRSRAYADVMSRAADMYDDFLQSKIMVPD